MQATTKTGTTKTVSHGDPLWCSLENRRVRFSRLIGSAVEVMDDSGRVLPDWRHQTQVKAL